MKKMEMTQMEGLQGGALDPGLACFAAMALFGAALDAWASDTSGGVGTTLKLLAAEASMINACG